MCTTTWNKSNTNQREMWWSRKTKSPRIPEALRYKSFKFWNLLFFFFSVNILKIKKINKIDSLWGWTFFWCCGYFATVEILKLRRENEKVRKSATRLFTLSTRPYVLTFGCLAISSTSKSLAFTPFLSHRVVRLLNEGAWPRKEAQNSLMMIPCVWRSTGAGLFFFVWRYF